MAFTQADLDNLDATYKLGAQEVHFSDGRVAKMFGVSDYITLRELIQGEIANQSGPTPIRQVRIFTTQGY